MIDSIIIITTYLLKSILYLFWFIHFMIPAFVHHFLQVLRILSDTIVSFFHENILGEKVSFFWQKKKTHLWERVLLKNNLGWYFFLALGWWILPFCGFWLLRSQFSAWLYTLSFSPSCSEISFLWCSAMSVCFVKMQISFFFFFFNSVWDSSYLLKSEDLSILPSPENSLPWSLTGSKTIINLTLLAIL